jgi:hypothetical protein
MMMGPSAKALTYRNRMMVFMPKLNSGSAAREEMLHRNERPLDAV